MLNKSIDNYWQNFQKKNSDKNSFDKANKSF